MRPPIRSLLAFAVLLGAAAGAVEVLYRAAPRQGLPVGDVALWLVVAMGLSVAATLALAGVAWAVGRRTWGVLIGLLVGVHATVNYRFEVVLNESVRDPRVWGGILALLVASVAFGVYLDGHVRKLHRATRPWLVGAVVVASVLAFVRARPPAGEPGPLPSVLVITLDTTRPDRLSPYGHDIDTPALQRLADEGVVFTQAVAAAPITEPSHLAMFTGLPPVASGVVSNGTDLGDRPALLWHALKRSGYLTAGFVAGFPLHGKYGWDQGMDVYDDDFGEVAGVQSLTLVKAFNQVAIKEHALRERPAGQVLARALPWLRSHRDEQFFAWVHFYDPHGPYVSRFNVDLGEPPRGGTGPTLPPYWPADHRTITSPAWLAAAYEGELKLVDDAVAQLLDALGPALDHTIVVVTADHGEALGEHDYWFDHGDDLYDPSLRVPWIVRFPPAAKAGLRVDCQVGGVDLAPTLLALAGVKDDTAREGVSRADELRGGDCRERPVFASTVAGRHVDKPPVDHAMRGLGAKLILKEAGGVELYDLIADPRELQNLAPNELAEKMGSVLRDRVAGGTAAKLPEQDAETEAALRALGYIE